MKKFILIITLVLSFSALYSQIRLELDTSFQYGLEGGTNYLVSRRINKVFVEGANSILVIARRCYNPNAYCGGMHRLSSNGHIMQYSYQQINLLDELRPENFFKTTDGFLIHPSFGMAWYKVSNNGSIGPSQLVYNNNLKNTMSNAHFVNSGNAYYNYNDGSLIAFCWAGLTCFNNTADLVRRFLSDGSEDTLFRPQIRGNLFMINRFDNDLFWGGKIMSYNQNNTRFIVKTDTLGNIDTTFRLDAGFDTLITTGIRVLYKQANGKLIIKGVSEYVDGSGKRDTLEFFRLNPNGTLDTTFNNLEVGMWRKSFTINGMAELPDGNLLVGGEFPEFGGLPYRSIAVLDSNGFALPNHLNLPKFNYSPDNPPDTNATQIGAVYGITPTPDGGYLVNGDFTVMDGKATHALIKLKSTWPVNTPTLTNGLQTLQLYPNPAQNQVRINLGQEISKPQLLYLRDISGKLVKTYSITEPNQTIDIGGVAKGLYFMSFQGYRVEKLVIN